MGDLVLRLRNGICFLIINLLQCGMGNYYALISQVSISNNLLNQGLFSEHQKILHIDCNNSNSLISIFLTCGNLFQQSIS